MNDTMEYAHDVWEMMKVSWSSPQPTTTERRQDVSRRSEKTDKKPEDFEKVRGASLEW